MNKQQKKQSSQPKPHLSPFKKVGNNKQQNDEFNSQSTINKKTKSLEHSLPRLKKQRQKKLITRLITLILVGQKKQRIKN